MGWPSAEPRSHRDSQSPSSLPLIPEVCLLGRGGRLSLGPETYPGFLDLSQLSRASLLKAAVAAMLLLFSWMLAMVSE